MLLNLENQLIQDGKSLEDFPWVLQYNKRDLPNAETLEAMETKLNFFRVPSFEAVAITGQGVFPTLKGVIKRVVAGVQTQLTGQRMRA
jgi:signal recognition particle receptor subunit beta